MMKLLRRVSRDMLRPSPASPHLGAHCAFEWGAFGSRVPPLILLRVALAVAVIFFVRDILQAP